ncbi:MAG: RluA family pseudouridine synthase [Candidatus Rifleibacteriota bacterium]
MRYDLELETAIDERSAGKSLLDAISERFSYHDLDYWLARIKNGQIKVNSQPAAQNQVLQLQDRLQFCIPDFEEPDINTDYKTIWRNEFLLLVNKPAGLPVHSTRRFFHQTLVAEIRRREGFSDINPLQRLDRETSGLMFLSRTSLVPPRFHKNFKKYLHHKYYLGIVRGKVNWQQQTVDTPLKECLQPPVRYRMIADPEGKAAHTDFFCIARNEDYSLLLIRLETGRKHQIRAHLDLLGHPLIGEKLYYDNGSFFMKRCDDNLTDEDLKLLGAHNHLLHAYALSTEFPVEGRRIFLAPPDSPDFIHYLTPFIGWQQETQRLIEAGESSDKF